MNWHHRKPFAAPHVQRAYAAGVQDGREALLNAYERLYHRHGALVRRLAQDVHREGEASPLPTPDELRLAPRRKDHR